RASSTTAHCKSSLDPKCAKSPLLLIRSAEASFPIVSPSRPWIEAMLTAFRRMARRVLTPRGRWPRSFTTPRSAPACGGEGVSLIRWRAFMLPDNSTIVRSSSTRFSPPAQHAGLSRGSPSCRHNWTQLANAHLVRGNPVFCVLWQIPLPNIRHKTMLDFLLVFPITRQIVCKQSLFVKQPPYQEWHHKRDFEGPPVRTKG